MHKFIDQGASNTGSAGCITAVRRAVERAKASNRSVAIRVTRFDVWFDCIIQVPLNKGEVEVGTVHCDGRIEFAERWVA